MKDEQIEILLEEPSMMHFLEDILPFILPEGYVLGENCFLRPHQGKSELRKSIPRKMQVFSNFYRPAKVIIIHDQDSNDCRELKAQLQELCAMEGACPVLIRIACRELENWYLGDMDAIQGLYPDFPAEKMQRKAKYREVDNSFGSKELEKMIAGFQKTFAAKKIAFHMEDLSANRSESFQQTISGIQNFLSE
jgi:hypothetical protein